MHNIKILLAVLFFSCGSQKPSTENTNINSDSQVKSEPVTIASDSKGVATDSIKDKQIDFSAGPPTIIYKTKKDFFYNVPVTLDQEKSTIVSYPGIKDISVNGRLTLPDKLTDDFLLDNRGINENTVFLTMTYEEYSHLKEPPAISDMYMMITDKHPFVEMYDCGNRYQYKNVITELSQIITEKKLKKFKAVTIDN